MKQLIPMNEFGLMAGMDCVARVDSRKIAEVFEKNHFDVLRSIKRIISDESGYSEGLFSLAAVQETCYHNS